MSLSFGELLRQSRVAAGLTQEELAERAEVSARGVRYLERGLRRPHRDTARRLAAALRLAEQDEVRFVAAARPPGPAGITAKSHPPFSPHPLIGRERDALEVRRLLTTGGVRLLTLTGPGGVGKTSLALDVAASLRDTFGVVVWVPLESLTDPGLVPSAIAKALGLVESGGSTLVDALAGALDGRAVLIVLDNVEHLTGGMWFVSDLIATCPELTVLATSRSALRLRTEHELPVAPLLVPAGIEELPVYAVAANPAVDLFLRRAQAVRPSFALTAHNAGAVVEICRQLDGLPLALELAAARARVLVPQVMLSRLSDRLALLTGGGGDLPARQRTMRETVAWSHDLLDPQEQLVLVRLAVFDGSFDAAAAESVLQLDQSTVLDAVECVQRANLLLLVDTVEDEPRFRMLGTVRDFALEDLERRPEVRELRERHAMHYVELAQRAAQAFYGPETARWLDLLEQDQDNLRAASRWLLDHGDAAGGLRLCAALWWFWYVRGHASEGRAELARFLVLPGSAQVLRPRAAALLGSGSLAQTQGDYEAARMFLAESVRLYRSIGNDQDTAAALLAAGFTARVQEDYEAAHSLLQEALALARSSGALFVVAAALHHLGMMASDADKDLKTAEALLQESLALYRDLRFPRFIALVLLSLGDVACAQQDYPRARRLLLEGLAEIEAAGERLGVHGALDALARLAAGTGDVRRAVTLAAAAQRLRTSTGSRSWPVVERQRARWLDRARASLTDQEFRTAWDAGTSRTTQQAVHFALEAPVEPDAVLHQGSGNADPVS